MLLFWSRDVARGRKIAAIRFESLVKLDAIRIVPAGISPFQALPEELGCGRLKPLLCVLYSRIYLPFRSTAPSRFVLNAKFNYQPDDPSDKTRAANSLVSMSMPFDGIMSDFPVVMDDVSSEIHLKSLFTHSSQVCHSPSGSRGPVRRSQRCNLWPSGRCFGSSTNPIPFKLACGL